MKIYIFSGILFCVDVILSYRGGGRVKNDWHGLGRSVTDAVYTLIDDTPSDAGFWCTIGMKT